MRKSKLGVLNPMFKKEKSKEFIEQMYKDKTGSNNPMFGKPKSEETLAKMRKKVYVYDSKKEFIRCYAFTFFYIHMIYKKKVSKTCC